MSEKIPHPDESSHVVSPPEPAPFVGREALFARLQQHSLDPLHRNAVVITGHNKMGKTATLNQLPAMFQDPIFTVVILPEDIPAFSTEALVDLLVARINALLDAHDFSLLRVPERDGTRIEANSDDDEDTDSDTEDADSAEPLSAIAWFIDVYMPEILAIVRPSRRLVWAFDDAGYLNSGADDTVGYLRDLLAQESQLAIVLSLDAEDDAALSSLHPLVDPARTERLYPLTSEDCHALIQAYAPHTSEDTLDKIARATGGYPQVLTWFGEALRDNPAATYETMRGVVYEKSDALFRDMWQGFTRDERLVLTAIASLIYDDPLRVVNAGRIESWLAETDFLLDIVAINAALRSLDYRDVVWYLEDGGIKLTVGLMQQWLLEQARLNSKDIQPSDGIPWQVIVLVGSLIVLIVLALLLLPPQFVLPEGPVPTATLAS